MCVKNWESNSTIYFEKGKQYIGYSYNKGKSVKMHGESGWVINFHEGSKYFDIGEITNKE